MKENDIFNVKSWEVADDVEKESVQYEFEDDVTSNTPEDTADLAKKNNHPEKPHREVLIVGRDEIQKNIEKKVTQRNGLNPDSDQGHKTESKDSLNTNTKKKRTKKILLILSACLLLIAILGGLGYFLFADSVRLNQVCRYVENNDFESATSMLSQMKPSLETVAVENLIKYAESYQSAEVALDSLTQTNQNDNLVIIDELKKSHESFVDKDKTDYLPEQIRYFYNNLEDNYQNKFSNIKTDSIKSYFQLTLFWSKLIDDLNDFEMNYEFYKKDEKGYYSKLKKNLDNFQDKYDSFSAYDSISDKYQLEYDKISKKATKLNEVDFDYLEELFDDSQSSLVYYYKHWTDKGFQYSIDRMQSFVDLSEASCNELKKELSNMFSSFDNCPSYIWRYVSDCEEVYETLQSDINRDKKEFTNSEELHSLDYDKNYTTTDYFVGFYDTKNENETRKNAAIAVNIVKAYLLAGDEINT